MVTLTPRDKSVSTYGSESIEIMQFSVLQIGILEIQNVIQNIYINNFKKENGQPYFNDWLKTMNGMLAVQDPKIGEFTSLSF